MRSGDNFPDAAIYISESGGDARVPYGLVGSPTIDISNNLIEDNYNGVTLWENADRSAAPRRTRPAATARWQTRVVKLSTCTATTITKAPYNADCRWKTQNVKVHHNTFKMNPERLANCPTEHVWPQRHLRQLRQLSRVVALQGRDGEQGHHLRPGQCLQRQHLRRAVELHRLGRGPLPDASAWQSAPYDQDRGSTFTG